MDTHVYSNKIYNVLIHGDALRNVSHPLKRIFFDYLDYLDKLDQSGRARPIVLETVQKSLLCNTIYLGYDIFTCPVCNNESLFAHKCHTRFCPSCGAKYSEQLAAKVSSFVLDVFHRHIVLTIPEQLRIYFLKDRDLLNLLFVAARNTICALFNKSLYNKLQRMKKKGKKIKNSFYLYKDYSQALDFGMIASLHTFGRSLNWNPHIHALVPLISYDHNKNTIKRHRYLDFKKLRKTFQFELLRLLSENLGPSFDSMKNQLYKNYPDGFYVYAKSHMDEDQELDSETHSKNIKDCINYCMRYAGRPVMAESRITDYNTDTNTVSWYYNDHTDEQRHDITEPATSFINKLIIHIPNKHFRTVRYFGFYANAAQEKLSKIHELLGSKNKTTKQLRHKKREEALNKLKFRTHLIDSYNRDPIKCSCGNTMIYSGSYEPLKGEKNDRPYREKCLNEMRELSIRRNGPRMGTRRTNGRQVRRL